MRSRSACILLFDRHFPLATVGTPTATFKVWGFESHSRTVSGCRGVNSRCRAVGFLWGLGVGSMCACPVSSLPNAELVLKILEICDSSVFQTCGGQNPWGQTAQNQFTCHLCLFKCCPQQFGDVDFRGPKVVLSESYRRPSCSRLLLPTTGKDTSDSPCR